MSCYSTYINNYNTAVATINESKKSNSAFAQFLKVIFLYYCQYYLLLQRVESDPEVRNQELETLIIAPVQQLPRYPKNEFKEYRI